MTDKAEPLLLIFGWIIGLIIFGAGVVFVAARTGLDLGGFGQAYFVSGILMLTTLIIGLAVIGYFSLSQRTNTLDHNRQHRGR